MEITLVLVVLVVLVVGLAAGAAVAFLVGRDRRPDPGAIVEEVRRAAEEAVRRAEEQRDAAVLGQLVTMNREVIGAERERTAADLDGARSAIGDQLGQMGSRITDVERLIRDLEAQRARGLGQLNEQLVQQQEGVTALLHTTQSLREALSSTKARGQWGERMAEDVLRLAGFVENVNYRKQRSLEGSRGIPDFTFLLPNELLLHMDVKFPLDNYLRCCEAQSDLERKRYRDDFLRDVRNRVKELTTREYVDAGGSTVDFVLLFIPNEQLYAFIHEHDDAILDEAVRRRVVLCSPLTLFAVLALVRQMVENFQLARTSDEILGLLGEFSGQWNKFVEQMDKVGTRIEGAGREYEALVGTRRRALERPLRKIDALRSRRDPGLELVGTDEEPVDGAEPPLALEA